MGKDWIIKKLKESFQEKLRSDDYSWEFVREDLGYFWEGSKLKPAVDRYLEALAYVRFFLKGEKNKRVIGKSRKKLSKKYGKRPYTYFVAYFDKRLKEKGYRMPTEKKRIMVTFNNVVMPVMSNAGLIIAWDKYRNNPVLKRAKPEELRQFIPKKWLETVDAFLDLIPPKST